MDKKTTGIVAYLTFILLFSLLSVIPCIGWLWGIFMIVCWVMGLIAAINEEEKPVPLLGGIKLLK